MLQQFGEEIWTVDGPTVSVARFAYPTRMIVVRLSNGALFVWSPTALSSELRAAIDSLGPVQHIVAPNTLHHIIVGEWQAAYPAAQFHAVSALRAKRPDLKWDRDLEDSPAPEWSNEIEQVVVGGNRITTEVVFFSSREPNGHLHRPYPTLRAGLVQGVAGHSGKARLSHRDQTDRSPKIPNDLPRS